MARCMTNAQEIALGIARTNPSYRTLRELTSVVPQRTPRSPPAQESASSNFNPAGVLANSVPSATGT
eukprot:5804736-Prorocentrum_lima.AAC.1